MTTTDDLDSHLFFGKPQQHRHCTYNYISKKLFLYLQSTLRTLLLAIVIWNIVSSNILARKTKELSRMKLFSTLMLLTSLVAVPSTGARIRGDNEKVRTIVRESLHSCHVWCPTNKNSTQRTLTSHSRSFCFF